MDVSLDELIKQKKVNVAKHRPGQQRQQQQQRNPRQQQPQVKRQQVGDARDRISKLRKQQLVSQDARQRINQIKRHNIKDARQILSGRKLPQQQLQQQQVRRPATAGVSAGAVGGISSVSLPKKVVANDLYRERPAPPPQLEYEDDDVAFRAPPQALPQRQRGREIPVVPVSRQRRDRSRSPVTVARRHAPLPPPPPPPPPPQTAIVQAYKVSISNLHPGVTREDIYELFSSVGAVKKCVLLREGSAEVVYPSKEHALAAVHRYDRRELDGMAMHLRLTVVGIKVHSASAAATGSSRASAAAVHAAGAIDERAVRAALFRSGSGGGGGGGRPVNFQVSM